MYISTSLLLTIALCWWLSDILRERQTPAYWAWRRDLAAWKRNRKIWKAEDRLERQNHRAAHDALWHRHFAIARRLRTISFRHYLDYIWHAPTTGTDMVFNRYVTLAEMACNAHTTAQPAPLPSLILTAPRLPGLPAGRLQQ